MNIVSSNGPRGQQPDVIPFDSRASVQPAHADIIEAMKHAKAGRVDPPDDDDFDHDRDTDLDTGGNGDNDDDPPPANVGAAMVIRAPRGILPVRPGFTLAAVVIEIDPLGEEDICEAHFLTTHKLQSEQVAVGLANYKSGFPGKLPIKATHIVVNDETGREVWRKPVLRVA